MFSEGQVDTDAFLRTLGWRHTAEAEWENLLLGNQAIAFGMLKNWDYQAYANPRI